MTLPSRLKIVPMIRNIWAVGRNYADHAQELGNPLPAVPLIFLKAGSCATVGAKSFALPPWKSEIHHEVELALRFNEQLDIDQAAVALDLTDRPKQIELKNRGEPWTLAKSFQGACPLSDFFPVHSLSELGDLEIRLRVNGLLRQSARTSLMLFGLARLTEYVRAHFPVCPGDVLLTGTPAGVAALNRGDHLEAELRGKMRHEWRVE